MQSSYINSSKSKVFIVVGSSGSGKSSVVKEAIRRYNALYTPKVEYGVTTTTRPLRPGEGPDDFHPPISTDEFIRRQDEGEFLESFQNDKGVWYGRTQGTYETILNQGKGVVVVAGFVQLARMIRENVMNLLGLPAQHVISILILSTTKLTDFNDKLTRQHIHNILDALAKRLHSRQTETNESEASIESKLNENKRELEQYRRCEYNDVIFNEEGGFERSVTQLVDIFKREMLPQQSEAFAVGVPTESGRRN